MEAGADINEAEADGATPLYGAAEQGHVQVIRMLIEAGAHIDQPENDGATPLYEAALKVGTWAVVLDSAVREQVYHQSCLSGNLPCMCVHFPTFGQRMCSHL